MLDEYLDRLQPESGSSAKQTTVARTVSALRKMSLSVEDGAYLGSENDLIERLAISRPTLRQAAKVTENEQLISVRRGINGGIFARRPTIRNVVQLPALWLRMQDATLGDMHVASQAIMPVIAARAAQCTDAVLIAEMRSLRSAIARTLRSGDSNAAILADDLKLVGLMGRMAENPALMLFADIAYVFGMYEREQRFYEVRERRDKWRELQLQLCDAILTPDPDIATLISGRRHQAIAGWMAEYRTPKAD